MPSKNGSKPATQADIEKLDAKIDERTKRLAMEILKTNDKIGSLEASIDKNTNRILSALDQYTKTAEASNRAVILHGQALSDHGQTLKHHD